MTVIRGSSSGETTSTAVVPGSGTVVSSSSELVITPDSNVVVVVGRTGPPGPASEVEGLDDIVTAALAPFEFSQVNAATQWGPIVHSLGTLRPDVDIYESDGSPVNARYTPIDADSGTITFVVPIAGVAVFTR